MAWCRRPVLRALWGLGLLGAGFPVPAAGGVPPEASAPARGPTPVRLGVLTSLPLFWGEKAAHSGAAAHRVRRPPLIGALERSFTVQPVDDLTAPGALPSPRAGAPYVLMLVQPRRLAPIELTMLDNWIRHGGHGLVFADPDLAWPSLYPLGDRRRPVPVTLIDPWFAHLGLTLSDTDGRAVTWRVGQGDLVSIAAGRVSARPAGGVICHAPHNLVADCRVGRGRLVVVGDADLLGEAQWRGQPPALPIWIAELVEALAHDQAIAFPVSGPDQARVVSSFGGLGWAILAFGGLGGIGLWIATRLKRTKRNNMTNK